MPPSTFLYLGPRQTPYESKPPEQLYVACALQGFAFRCIITLKQGGNFGRVGNTSWLKQHAHTGTCRFPSSLSLCMHTVSTMDHLVIALYIQIWYYVDVSRGSVLRVRTQLSLSALSFIHTLRCHEGWKYLKKEIMCNTKWIKRHFL